MFSPTFKEINAFIAMNSVKCIYIFLQCTFKLG